MIDGDRLRNLREQFGYSREEIAKLLDIGVAQIWRYESGKNDPSSEVVGKYAKLFSVSSDYLLGLTDNRGGQAELELSITERQIISALRRGKRLEAIMTIASEAGENLDETQDCAGV